MPIMLGITVPLRSIDCGHGVGGRLGTRYCGRSFESEINSGGVDFYSLEPKEAQYGFDDPQFFTFPADNVDVEVPVRWVLLFVWRQ